MSALAAVYVFWGSTAPAMKIAVATLPPWWLTGIRFTVAGTLLWTWCRWRGVALPTVAEWRQAAGTGIVLLIFGNALFAWTLQYLPSGVDSLVFAFAPLWMALFAFVLYGERLSRMAVCGLALGLAGMLFLYSPSGGQHLPLIPTAIAVATSFAWGFGSIVQRRMRASNVMQVSAMQALTAGLALIVVASATGEPLAAGAFTPATLGALAYLVVFGSIVAFSAYLWLMNNVATTLASTYAYVNPVVSLAIGIGLLHEPASWRLVFGACIILLGVGFIVAAPRRSVVR